jgi:hypothetical protein
MEVAFSDTRVVAAGYQRAISLQFLPQTAYRHLGLQNFTSQQAAEHPPRVHAVSVGWGIFLL